MFIAKFLFLIQTCHTIGLDKNSMEYFHFPSEYAIQDEEHSLRYKLYFVEYCCQKKSIWVRHRTIQEYGIASKSILAASAFDM